MREEARMEEQMGSNKQGKEKVKGIK